MDQVHWTIFDEAHERLNDITTQLSNVRDILSADEDSLFDDEGGWTDAGIAVVATHIQDIEFYKNALKDVEEEIANLDMADFDSEQEYYDKVTELTNKQHDYTMAISDSEQSIVDMYESSIDAAEEYIGTLIDGYSDYIDNVKEALDAERDLYDFKRKIEDQSKSVAETERKIAALSGSTNAADIAERRRLEKTLYDQKRDLDDSYRDHAKQSQQDALDAEQKAYEETMTKMVEGMRDGLKDATANMEQFINAVTVAVSMNAQTVLDQYEATGLLLTPAVTNPWIDARDANQEYVDKAKELMDVWKKDGYFAEFASNAGTNLSSPWTNGKSAAEAFGESVGGVMTDMYTSIKTNVVNSITELNKLKAKYDEIKDYEGRTGGTNGGYVDPDGAGTQKKYRGEATLKIGSDTLTATVTANSVADAKTGAMYDIARKYEKLQQSKRISPLVYETAWERTWKNKVNIDTYPVYAKGTTGTKKDELAIVDEFGPELILHADPTTGRLQYLTKGSGVIPTRLTENLMEWGQFTPDDFNFGAGVNVNMINNAVNKPEFNFEFDALVKAERIDENTLPEVKRFVQQEINSLVKQMNYAIKGKGGR
jgi:hypothetical protein